MAIRVRVLNPDDSLPSSEVIRDEEVSVGSADDRDLRLTGEGVAPAHATFKLFHDMCSVINRDARVVAARGVVEIGGWQLVAEPLNRDFSHFGEGAEGETRGGMPIIGWCHDDGWPYRSVVRLPRPESPAGLWWHNGAAPPETRALMEARFQAHRAFEHPNVIPLVDWDLDGPHPETRNAGWCTPLVPGVSLRYLAEIIRPRPHLLTRDVVFSLARDMAVAIAALRSDPILVDLRLQHSSVWLGWDGRLRIAVQHHAWGPIAPPVHTRWFAPEQLDTPDARFGGSDLGAGSDQASVFTMGLLLYTLAAGAHPREVGGRARPVDAIATARREPLPSVRHRAPRLDDACTSLIDKCIELHPAERPTLDALQHLESGGPSAVGDLLQTVAGPEKERQLTWLAGLGGYRRRLGATRLS